MIILDQESFSNMMNANEDHVLNGGRPAAANMENVDDGHAEQFLNRNGAYDNDPELLRRKHQEGMSKKAHSVCCRTHADPMVKLLLKCFLGNFMEKLIKFTLGRFEPYGGFELF